MGTIQMKPSIREKRTKSKRPNLRRDQKGKIKAGRRRKREEIQPATAIALVFEELGGVQAMVRWAKTDDRTLAIFYSKVYPKLIAAQGQDDVPANTEQEGGRAQKALEEILARIVAERKEAEGQSPPIIEHEPDEGSYPRLVAVRPSGPGEN
jgi:hypothetical protein